LVQRTQSAVLAIPGSGFSPRAESRGFVDAPRTPWYGPRIGEATRVPGALVLRFAAEKRRFSVAGRAARLGPGARSELPSGAGPSREEAMQPTSATKRQNAEYPRKKASQFRKGELRVTRRLLGEPGPLQPAVARRAMDWAGRWSPRPSNRSQPAAFRNSVPK